MKKEKSKAYMNQSGIFSVVLGELGNYPAERTVTSVDPANLNQVILAEGNKSENKREHRLYK
jgi:hypothetical protein